MTENVLSALVLKGKKFYFVSLKKGLCKCAKVAVDLGGNDLTADKLRLTRGIVNACIFRDIVRCTVDYDFHSNLRYNYIYIYNKAPRTRLCRVRGAAFRRHGSTRSFNSFKIIIHSDTQAVSFRRNRELSPTALSLKAHCGKTYSAHGKTFDLSDSVLGIDYVTPVKIPAFKGTDQRFCRCDIRCRRHVIHIAQAEKLVLSLVGFDVRAGVTEVE